MRKIILKISLLLTFIVLFTISVFAFTVPSEYDGTKYGANYDTSHESNDCCPYPEASSVPADSHYEKGYSDGFLDGYQSGLESDELSEEQKQTFLNEFLASGAYAQLIEQAIEDYKNSIEFHAELMAAYENGVLKGDNGYNKCEQNKA